MGSDVHVLVPERRAPERADAVEALFAEWEAVLSRFRPESELSRLNDRAGAPVRVGPILLAAVEASLEAARATGGLFDPTLRHELVRIGYDRSFEELGGRAAEAAGRPRGGGGWRRVVVDRAAGHVTLPAGSGLDLGGIAKGMAVDASLELLSALGADAALVSAGGDLAVLGLPPGRRAWPILVGGGPDGPVVPLVRGALATSGTAAAPLEAGAGRAAPSRRPRDGRARRQRAQAGDGRRGQLSGGGGRRDRGVRRRTPARRHVLARLGLAGLLVTETGREVRVGRWPGAGLERAA